MRETKKYERLQVMFLLLIILFDPSYKILITIIVLVVLESKKRIHGVKCNLKRDLKNKVAIVTGGNTGIGKETVIGLVQNGCEVIIAARDQNKSNNVIE